MALSAWFVAALRANSLSPARVKEIRLRQDRAGRRIGVNDAAGPFGQDHAGASPSSVSASDAASAALRSSVLPTSTARRICGASWRTRCLACSSNMPSRWRRITSNTVAVVCDLSMAAPT